MEKYQGHHCNENIDFSQEKTKVIKSPLKAIKMKNSNDEQGKKVSFKKLGLEVKEFIKNSGNDDIKVNYIVTLENPKIHGRGLANFFKEIKTKIFSKKLHTKTESEIGYGWLEVLEKGKKVPYDKTNRIPQTDDIVFLTNDYKNEFCSRNDCKKNNELKLGPYRISEIRTDYPWLYL